MGGKKCCCTCVGSIENPSTIYFGGNGKNPIRCVFHVFFVVIDVAARQGVCINPTHQKQKSNRSSETPLCDLYPNRIPRRPPAAAALPRDGQHRCSPQYWVRRKRIWPSARKCMARVRSYSWTRQSPFRRAVRLREFSPTTNQKPPAQGDEPEGCKSYGGHFRR